MVRITTSVVALCAALIATAPAAAADYNVVYDQGDNGDQLRSGYAMDPSDWTGLGDKDDTMNFEFGLRYWYSQGASSWPGIGGSFGASDTSHILEGHLRIEDHSTNTFATAIAGYSMTSSGSYDDPFHSGSISSGHIGYIGADLGWNTWADGKGSGIGPIVGYQYYNDQLLTRQATFVANQPGDSFSFDQATGDITGGYKFDSAPNNIDVNMLRLGASAKADLGFFDVTGTLAAVPYAMVKGVVGDDELAPTYTATGAGNNIDVAKASATAIDGWGYGAAADVMLRVHPVKNMTIGLGGRVWYLQGSADASFDTVHIGDPTDSDPLTNPPNFDTAPDVTRTRWVQHGDPFSMMRYGITAELSYAF